MNNHLNILPKQHWRYCQKYWVGKSKYWGNGW